MDKVEALEAVVAVRIYFAEGQFGLPESGGKMRKLKSMHQERDY